MTLGKSPNPLGLSFLICKMGKNQHTSFSQLFRTVLSPRTFIILIFLLATLKAKKTNKKT